MRATLSLSALAFAAVLGLATPALADIGSVPSIERAIMAASAYGMVGFSEIQYDDGQWELEGRDPRGRTLTIKVNAITGAVVNVDRW